jgi:hypothetical protein
LARPQAEWATVGRPKSELIKKLARIRTKNRIPFLLSARRALQKRGANDWRDRSE